MACIYAKKGVHICHFSITTCERNSVFFTIKIGIQ